MSIVFDFSGIYGEQHELMELLEKQGDLHRCDWRGMEGVNGYCSEEAAAVIEKKLECFPTEGIHFLDNGNFHYLSRFFLDKIKEPFDLVVFDHHTDMQPPGLIPCLSCGSWVLDSMNTRDEKKSMLQEVILIGPPEGSECKGAVLVDELSSCDKDTAARKAGLLFDTLENRLPKGADGELSESRLSKGEAGELSNGSLPGKTGEKPVYISVDKDVLAETEVRLNWDQGIMTLETLKKWLIEISRHRRICGLDICGEPLYNQIPDQNTQASEKINIELLLFFGRLKS